MIVSKGNVVLKRNSLNKRVIQVRRVNPSIFTDADIKIGVIVNATDRTNAGSLIITFDKVLDWFIGNFGIGDNVNLYKRTDLGSSLSKNFNINQDNNGAGNGSNFETFPDNFLFLSRLDEVTQISISRSGSGIQSVSVSILGNLPNLISYMCSIPQAPNWLFLDAIPQIKVLSFQLSTDANWQNTSSLTNSNLISLSLLGFNTGNPNIFAIIPPSLYHIRITQMTALSLNLAQYFTGSRLSFIADGSAGGFINTVSYSGGGLFPSNFADTPAFPISYIIRLNPQITNKLTGNQLSQFLIDFANQVNTVNLVNPVAKRMVFSGSAITPGYTDNTKPISTVEAAVAKITGTGAGQLGIQIFYS